MCQLSEARPDSPGTWRIRLCTGPRSPQHRGLEAQEQTVQTMWLSHFLQPQAQGQLLPLLEVFPSYLPVPSNSCSKVKLLGYRPGKMFLAATQRKNPLSTKPSQAHIVGPNALRTEHIEWWHTQHRTLSKTYLNQGEFRQKDRSGWKDYDSHPVASTPKSRLTEILPICRTSTLMR